MGMSTEEYNNYLINRDLNTRSQESQMGVYAPQMQEQINQAQSVLVAQTNPALVVEQIILRLEGKRKVGNKIEVWGEPKLNQLGLSQIRFILESCINQGIILTRFSDKQIAKIIIQLGDDLTDDLTLNWKLYGIKNKMDLDIIEDGVLFSIYAALNRALDQNEKNWLGKISIEHIAGTGNVPKPKDGFLSKLRL